MIYGVFYCLQKSEVFRIFLQVFRNWPISACREGLQSTHSSLSRRAVVGQKHSFEIGFVLPNLLGAAQVGMTLRRQKTLQRKTESCPSPLNPNDRILF